MTDYRPSQAIRASLYVAASTVAAVASVGFLGRIAGNYALAGQTATYNAMVPVTALALMLLAAALAVRVAFPHKRAFVTAAAVIVCVVVLLELVDLLARLPVAPDRLFASAAQMAGARQIGRMSWEVGLGLAALGVALLLSFSVAPARRSAAVLLSLFVGNMGFALAIGYAYDAPLLYAGSPSPPSLPAVFGLALLGVAFAAVTADRWPLAMFVGDSVRARLMRAIFPVIVGTTVMFAALDVAYHRLGLAQSPVLMSSIFVASVVVVSLTVVRSASDIGGRIDRSDTALKESNVALEKMLRDVAAAMGRVVEARDPYTQGHERRVAALAVRIARDMGVSDFEVDGIEMAGLLHDIGKLRVPASILTMPGRLSAAEYSLIKEHAQAGYEILKDIAFPWEIAEAVRQHHERMDGSGYPRGLSGDGILMSARILAVADVVEAMANDRPYRAALGLERAMEEISTHPERYDPSATASCIALYAAGNLGMGGIPAPRSLHER